MGGEKENEEIEIIEGEDPNAAAQTAQDDHEDHDEQDGDERLSETLSEDERNRREARREQRKTRKRSQQYARDKTREEMQWLIEQNKMLEQRLKSVEDHALTAQKGSLDQDYQRALYTVQATEAALAKAIEIGEGSRVPELLRQRDRALAEAAQINRAKQTVAAPPVPMNSTEVAQRAAKWASENSWFNANGSDPDSMVAKAVDSSLIAEGFDPASKRYWKELNRRLAERLPHRFDEDGEASYNEPKAGRRGPPVGGSRDITPGKRQVYVSPERVQALKDAGIWDDPQRREKILKMYSAYDRENKAAR